MAEETKKQQRIRIEPAPAQPAPERGCYAVRLGAYLAIYLMPMAYGVITSLKSKSQTSDPSAPVWPAEAVAYEHEGG